MNIAIEVVDGCVVAVFVKGVAPIDVDVEVLDCDGDDAEKNEERVAAISVDPNWKAVW